MHESTQAETYFQNEMCSAVSKTMPKFRKKPKNQYPTWYTHEIKNKAKRILKFRQNFKICEGLSSDAILGMNFRLRNNVLINCTNKRVEIGKKIKIPMDPEYIQKLEDQHVIEVLRATAVLTNNIIIPPKTTIHATIGATEDKPQHFTQLQHIIDKGISVNLSNTQSSVLEIANHEENQ